MENQENQNDQSQAPEAPEDTLVVDELSILKERAKVLGITFSNNIGVDALRAKIQAKIDADEADTIQQAADDEAQAPAVKVKTLRQHLYEENMKLVRLRITNMDPKKKDLQGEFITVANEHIGTHTKFIPFGEHSDNGYHVPYCIYKALEQKRFLSIRVTKVAGKEVVRQEMAREYALEVLPQLTKAEIAELKAAQAAAAGT